MILKHLDKNNLHHAYLIEGIREEIVPEILDFIETLGIKTTGNADFSYITLDSFKIENARELKAFSVEKGMTTSKRIFLISANNFLLEAQNTLLKMFEEPIENTHFFLIVPDASALLKTFVSRFYLISTKQNEGENLKEVENFISMPLQKRIDFIKELLIEEDAEDENGEEIVVLNSPRSKALRFLNQLEGVLYKNYLENFERGRFQSKIGGIRKNFPSNCFMHFFKVRQFLRQPGSSAKNLMESVAIIVPNFKN